MTASAANPPQSTAASGTLLEVRSVAKRFGAANVLKNISLDIAAGEFLTLLGESGSGKTTLLRLIAGFEAPTSGEIWMSGQRLDTLPPYRRAVNTVFQHYALFPHLNVRENVAYGLRVKKTPGSEVSGRVDEALRMVKMHDFANARPVKLSGGQQQRIALARALVNRPQLLLLDEPLSALDANLRKQMQSELKSLQREIGITFLFVTHDQEEAMALSDRIALLRGGAVSYTHLDVYKRQVIKELVEAVASDINSEFCAVIADNLAVVVRPLKRVAHLRQFALVVVADGEASADAHKRHALTPREVRGDSGGRIGRVRKAVRGRDLRPTGVMHARQNIYGMVGIELSFAKVIEAEFIHR